MDKPKKRHFKRYPEDFNVRISKVAEDSYIEIPIIDIGKSINVSATGILVNIKESIEVGTCVSIQFLKPHTFDFFNHIGKVVRVEKKGDKGYQVAINFGDLTESELQDLDYYLTRPRERQD
jgi:hypothetical protein